MDELDVRKHKMTLPLEKRAAVFVALLGLWVLACLGVFIVTTVGAWALIPSDNRSLMTAYISGFYLANCAAQLPAVTFVALVVSNSSFRHPILTAGLVTMLYQMTMLGIHLARQSGAFSFGPYRWLAFVFYFTGIIALVLIVMLITWILGKANRAPVSD